MEKASGFKSKIWFLLAIFIAAMALSAAVPAAHAGTVMAQPAPKEVPQPGENYPESRFGQPPARIETGVRSGYASRAVIDLEDMDDETGSTQAQSDRSPAGLVFKGQVARQQRPDSGGRTSKKPAAGNHSDSKLGGLPDPVTASNDSLETNSEIARKGVQEVSVIASDLGFFPKTLFVSRDVPVRMFVTGASKNSLCIMMDSFQVRKQVRSQKIEEITFTPNVPGKYRFYCPVNGMEGTMVVKELASSNVMDPEEVGVVRKPAEAQEAE